MFIKFSVLAKQLNIYLNHFPKAEKYALSARIRNSAYEVFDLMTEGQKRYQNKIVRRHSIYRFKRNLRAGRTQAVISSLGHAMGTASLPHLINAIKESDHGKNLSLSNRFRRIHHLPLGR